MKQKRNVIQNCFSHRTAVVLAGGIASGALAAELSLTDVPLFLDSSVQPNIEFIVDDSGSMEAVTLEGNPSVDIGYTVTQGFDYTPSVSLRDNREMLRSCAGANVLYYDPRNVYTPWKGKDKNGREFADQYLWVAQDEPYGGTDSSTRNLTVIDGSGDYSGFFPWYDQNGNGRYDLYVDLPGGTDGSVDNFVDLNGNGTFDGWVDLNGNGVYDPGEFESERECPSSSMPRAHLVDWFVDVTEMGDSTQNEIGFADNPLTGAELKTNFANWYSYYRKRDFVVKRALSELITDSSARVGLRTLWNRNSVYTEITDVDDISTPVDTDAQKNKANLLSQVFKITPGDATPLRTALSRSGSYFSSADGPILSEDEGGTCQQNFAIMLTDGFQNGGINSGYGNADSDSSSPYDNKEDSTYADLNAGVSNTLADIAMYYYERDLRTDLANKVPAYVNLADGIRDTNPAQHLVTYTVAFGVTGTLDPDVMPWETNFAGWPTPVNNSASSIDDVWHAAYNGRGLFLSASNPDELITSLNATVQDLTKRDGSASAVAVNSGSISSTSMLFQAKFNSNYWSGQINGIPIGADGKLETDSSVLASVVPRESERFIVTHNGLRGGTATGIPFTWGDLSEDQKKVFETEAMVKYIRGDRSNEGTDDGDFRVRDGQVLSSLNSAALGPLGDIVNSSPVYVGDPEFLYPDTLETQKYSLFRADPDGDSKTKKVGDKTQRRAPVLYVGSNDGFLHAFNVDQDPDRSASFGRELFAYVPTMVMDRLPNLASQYYDHQYTVDGSPTVGDAFFDNQWHSVLVSGLNGGGQGIFALDVTNPAAFSAEDKVAEKVLWEFSDDDDQDMGYSYSKPIITKSKYGDDNRWVAIFGNGYNNTEDDGKKGSGTAVLYVVDLETGALIKKIDTGVNDRSSPNGLSSPVALDLDGDYITDYVYAGDLEGNLWKFDLKSENDSEWGVAYEAGGKNMPLFVACSESPCTADNRQPITVQPKVGINRGATGHIIYFGTGTYIFKSDNENTALQSFYGIWDKQEALLTRFDRSHLLQQDILEEFLTDFGTEQRLTTRNLIKWHRESGLPTDGSDDDNLVDTHLGWRLDLINTHKNNTTGVGERLVTDISLRDDQVIFNTSIPDKDPCGAGGDGWFMSLDATSGAGPAKPVIDVNLDGKFDKLDLVLFDSLGIDGDPVASSGTKTPALATGCVFVTLADGSQVCLANTSDATVAEIGVSSGTALGRWMWRELND